MSRRSHITVVGSIATTDLSSIGAGEKEGWLSDSSSILTSLYSNAMAIANSLKSVVLVLGWDPPSTLVEIRPSLYLDDDGGTVSAIEWIPFGDLIALAVGTSSGMLLIFSMDGELIHKQLIYPACILRLRYHETTGISLQDNDAQQLSIVLPGVVARFDGADIQSLLQRWFEEASTRIWEDIKDPEDDSTFVKIPFQLWSVNKYGSCVDAAIVGLMPPPLLELQLFL